MAKLPSAFNPNDHEEMQSFSALPTGDYICRITESKIKDCGENAKDPNGKYIALTFTVEQPEKFAKRKLWVNLNIINKNQTAVDIANSELTSITKACGINRPITDTEELHGKPMKLSVVNKPDPRSKDFPPVNEVKGYSSVDSAVQSNTSEPAKTGGKKKMPWE